MQTLPPQVKRIKYSSTRITTSLFQDKDDIQVYDQLVYFLDELLNNDDNLQKIDLFIIKEISEYATGNYIKCIEDKCNGDIHYLYGDNCGDNFKVYGYTDRQQHHCQDLTYAYCLFKYKCDDTNCTKISHLLKCNDEECGLMIQFDREEIMFNISTTSIIQCYSGYYCKKKCYCKNHWSRNGKFCDSCDSFWCQSCIKANPNYCIQCKKYICFECKKQLDSSLCMKCLD